MTRRCRRLHPFPLTASSSSSTKAWRCMILRMNLSSKEGIHLIRIMAESEMDLVLDTLSSSNTAAAAHRFPSSPTCLQQVLPQRNTCQILDCNTEETRVRCLYRCLCVQVAVSYEIRARSPRYRMLIPHTPHHR